MKLASHLFWQILIDNCHKNQTFSPPFSVDICVAHGEALFTVTLRVSVLKTHPVSVRRLVVVNNWQESLLAFQDSHIPCQFHSKSLFLWGHPLCSPMEHRPWISAQVNTWVEVVRVILWLSTEFWIRCYGKRQQGNSYLCTVYIRAGISPRNLNQSRIFVVFACKV